MPNTRAFTRGPSRRLLVVAQTLHLPLPTPRCRGTHADHATYVCHTCCLPHESLQLWSPLAKHISRVFLLWLFPSLVIIFVVYFICLLLCVLFVVVLEKIQTVLMQGQGIIFSVFAEPRSCGQETLPFYHVWREYARLPQLYADPR